MIGLFQRYVAIGHVQMRSVSVHVFCDKAAIIVGKASFSEGYTYCSVYTFTSVLSARRGYFLRVKRATRWVLFNKGVARNSTTTYCEAVYRLADTSRSVSVGMRFVTFVKSNAKALLTLRIKSPLRSAEGIG